MNTLNKTINIAINKLHPHPDNPRKDLGDLTELVESIKKNGIMQNLTVIPKAGEPGEYITIIGHRRCAAAKLAGITKVPCRVVDDMDDKEQISTMLEENMQRNDLTILEQAQGFQMMLDLGETEDTIAEKTGFSKTTIKHRLNIAKLDQKTLREKEKQEGYQLTLTDLYELEKIKDVKIRDKILKESTDSRDLSRRALNAQNNQKRQENLKLYLEVLKKLGVKKAPKEADSELYSNKWERLEQIDLDKEPPKRFKLKESGDNLVYLERYGWLHIIRPAKKEKKVLTPQEEQKKQNDKNKRQVKAILKEAANTRRIFIEGIISGKIDSIKDTRDIELDLFNQLMDFETFTGHNKLKQFFLGCEVYKADKEDIDSAEKKLEGLTLVQMLLCMVSAVVAEQDLMEWNYTYRKMTAEKVKKFYAVLEKYGFQFDSEEEKAVIEGTSDLYVKKEKE